MNNQIINCINLSKSYHDGSKSLDVLKNINFSINAGDRIAIVGPSGSGKSTFLHLLGGLDKPTSGQVFQAGFDWQKLSEKERCKLRNKDLGFVYQFHHLLPEFSAIENVAMPLLLAGVSVIIAKDRAKEILNDVGLSARLTHKPSQLSGGERQRVAIARALVHRPICVFADEPTGNLDQTTAQMVFDHMLSLNEKYNTALIVVTHDRQMAGQMDKVLELRAGNLAT
jgi:lipoprotein-releasing system ATP-binding protein